MRRRRGELGARGIESEQMARGRVARDRNRPGEPGKSERPTLHIPSLAARALPRYKSAPSLGQGEGQRNVMPSFNIVSRIDLAEVENALLGLARGEMAFYPMLLWREKPGSTAWPP